jgi:hypothetical protein
MRHFRILIALVALAGIIGCRNDAPTAPSAPDPAVASDRKDASQIERFVLNLDDDDVSDELTLYPAPAPDGPGRYSRLKAVLSRSGTHTIEGRWDPPSDDDYPRRGNLIASQNFFVGRFQRAGTLIFLFGGTYSCCLPSLEIYRVSDHGVEAYFRADQFGFTEPLRPLANEVTVLEGIEWLSMPTGCSAPDVAQASTYQPIFVVRLEETAKVDVAESEKRTRETLGGFAGLVNAPDICAIRSRDGSRSLWDEKLGQRVF